MDLLILLALYALFFVPVLLRIARQERPRADIGAVLRRPFVEPGMGVQLAGGTCAGLGVALAATADRVGPAASARAIVGTLLLLGAAALGGWSLVHLRSWRFCAVVDEAHELCTSGPYAFVRHPIYVALALAGLGTVLWVPSAVTALGAGLLVLGGDLRARAEERALDARFGDRYRDYARRVRRFVPGL